MIRKFMLYIMVFCTVIISLPAQTVAGAGNNSCEIVDKMGSMGYVKKLTGDMSISRYGWCMESYIYDNNDGTFCVVDVYDDEVYIDTYNKETMGFIKFNKVGFLLEKFGGFYCGKDYNYIVFGRDNPTMNKDITTFALVKYDKQTWQIKGILELKNNDTIVSLRSGSLRMAEYGNNLIIRTSHQMYNTHQSSASFIVNTETMTGKYFRQDNSYVSHSFNQYVKTSGKDFAFVDLGDAAPRSVVLRVLPNSAESGDLTGSREEADLFPIPGDGGANCTGVTVGGFEMSDTDYITAISTIDHSKVYYYTNFEMWGLDRDERDIVILTVSKNNISNDAVRKIYLTDYVDKGKCGSVPYLVRITDDLFMVLWQEFNYSSNNLVDAGLKYVYIDGKGNVIGDIRTFDGGTLARDCQPVVINGKVTWFINTLYGHRLFHAIEVDLPYITAECDGKKLEVTCENVPEDSSVYIAFFKDDILTSIAVSSHKGEKLVADKPDGCTKAMVMVTDNEDKFKPICTKKIINFEGGF